MDQLLPCVRQRSALWRLQAVRLGSRNGPGGAVELSGDEGDHVQDRLILLLLRCTKGGRETLRVAKQRRATGRDFAANARAEEGTHLDFWPAEAPLTWMGD